MYVEKRRISSFNSLLRPYTDAERTYAGAALAWQAYTVRFIQLRASETAVHVDRSRENHLVVVRPIGGGGRDVGDGRESRIVRRRRVRFHFVADRKRPVQSAPERVHPTQMLRAVLGRRLYRVVDRNRKKKRQNGLRENHVYSLAKRRTTRAISRSTYGVLRYSCRGRTSPSVRVA